MWKWTDFLRIKLVPKWLAGWQKFRCLYRRKFGNLYQNHKHIYPLIQQSLLGIYPTELTETKWHMNKSILQERRNNPRISNGGCIRAMEHSIARRMKRLPSALIWKASKIEYQVKNARLQSSVKSMFLLRKKRTYTLICLLLHKETLQSHLRN